MTLDVLGSWVGAASLLSAAPLGVAWLMSSISSLLSRQRASVRHHLWVIALAIAVLAPLARLAVPRIEVPLWPATFVGQLTMDEQLESDAGSVRSGIQSIGRVGPARDTGISGGRRQRVEASRARRVYPYRAILAILWLIGAVWLSAIRVVRRVRLARIVLKGRRPDAPSRFANIRVHEAVVVPMLAGIRRPTILLPSAATDWPVEELEAVLAHERAHLARRDHLVALLCDLAIAAYWINPLVWVAASALEREREQACDEEVVHMGVKPSVYAAALLRVAQGLPSRTGIGAAPAMAGRLDARVRAVLAARTPRAGHVPMSWRATLALLAPCALMVGSVHVVARTTGTQAMPVPSHPPSTASVRPATIDPSVTTSGAGPADEVHIRQQTSSPFVEAMPQGTLVTGEIQTTPQGTLAGEIQIAIAGTQQPAPDKAGGALITVFGEVRAPGRYPFVDSKSVLEALAEAGGTTNAAGGDAEVLGANGERRAVLDMADARTLHAFKLRPGDVVTVPKAGVFYIAGQVRTPGAYVWQRGRTLSQAVTLAGGLTDFGTYRDAIATRLEDGKRVEVLLGENGLIQPDDQIKISSGR